MTDLVHKLISECVKDKGPDDAVFTWNDGRPVKDFRGAWSKLVKAAEIPSLRLHDFRRTAVNNFEDLGVSREVARSITGHKTDAIYSRYNIVHPGRLANAAEVLNARDKAIGRELVTADSGASKQSTSR